MAGIGPPSSLRSPRPCAPLPFKRIMLDGEAVAHCLEGLPDFHRLLGDGQAMACFYDLLWLEAQDLRGVELIGRRRILEKALRKAKDPCPVLRFSEHLEGGAGRGDVPPRMPHGARRSRTQLMSGPDSVLS
jgi:hypothetical protein